MEKETKINYSTPIAIVIAAVIIAGAMYFNDGRAKAPLVPPSPVKQTTGLERINPVTATDHIRGNPNAQIIIVEYSDTECYFCGLFHPTMKQVMDEYGKAGKVAWVYRHSPLDQLHSKSRLEAVALECANELGGNEKFWEYTDRIYEITPANDGLDLAELPKIAKYVGLDEAKFTSCLSTDKYDDKIENDLQNGQATGANGTPWSVVLTKNGRNTSINGAQSYTTVKKVIDDLLVPLK